ncbi:MAG: hypothetical protein Aureis2KO_30780 [Aureisphaera sp.]
MKYNLSEMSCLDLYLSTLSVEEQEKLKDEIVPSKALAMPLLSWDLFSENYSRRLQQARKGNDIKNVAALAQRYDWKNDVQSILSEHEFDAIVITDAQQKIVWVNEGFTTMTGYPKSFALDKSPKFLQGKETSETTRKKIKAQLKKDRPFKEIITNYKKDQVAYDCEVRIFPLYNEGTTHYLALEREVG